MTSATIQVIDDCAHQSHAGTIHFGTVVERLATVGVESYHVDYRGGQTTYYSESGQAHAVRLVTPALDVGAKFDGEAVRAAVRAAQRGEVLYPEFVRRTVAAGCIGYDVWIAGRHVVYHGRRGERHVEWFADATPPADRTGVEVVKQVYAAFARRDLPAALALFAADAVIEQSTEVPWGGHFQGHAGAREFFAGLLQRLDSTLVFERFIDAGEHVVAIGRTQGHERAHGRRYDVPVAHLWRVRDGLVERVVFCIDNPTMLGSLGSPAVP